MDENESNVIKEGREFSSSVCVEAKFKQIDETRGRAWHWVYMVMQSEIEFLNTLC